MSKPLDLTGQRFGKLVVVSRSESKNGKSLWECRCDCGRISLVVGNKLTSGTTKSCRCLRVESPMKHGGSRSPEYQVWCGIIQRCTNPNAPEYFRYGARGITICERWRESFENFLMDMGPRTSSRHTIERSDNDKGYSKDNCRWATQSEQNRNTRIRKDNSTGVPGVHRAKGKFFARIKLDSGIKHLGTFSTIEEATEVRRQAEIQYWGKERPSHQ